MEAVKAMKEGKKVRRKIDCKILTFYMGGAGNVIRFDDEDKHMVSLSYDDFEATDWEIYEEKTKT